MRRVILPFFFFVQEKMTGLEIEHEYMLQKKKTREQELLSILASKDDNVTTKNLENE